MINHKSLVLCVLFLPFLPLERVFSWCVFRENPVHMVYQKPILTLNHRQEVRISCHRIREIHSFHCLLSFFWYHFLLRMRSDLQWYVIGNSSWFCDLKYLNCKVSSMIKRAFKKYLSETCHFRSPVSTGPLLLKVPCVLDQ